LIGTPVSLESVFWHFGQPASKTVELFWFLTYFIVSQLLSQSTLRFRIRCLTKLAVYDQKMNHNKRFLDRVANQNDATNVAEPTMRNCLQHASVEVRRSFYCFLLFSSVGWPGFLEDTSIVRGARSVGACWALRASQNLVPRALVYFIWCILFADIQAVHNVVEMRGRAIGEFAHGRFPRVADKLARFADIAGATGFWYEFCLMRRNCNVGLPSPSLSEKWTAAMWDSCLPCLANVSKICITM
jgi:hypothetical protein